MRRNSTSSMGALHPVLFFTLVYGISLVLSIFVCRTVYYSLNNDNRTGSTDNSGIKSAQHTTTDASLALR